MRSSARRCSEGLGVHAGEAPAVWLEGQLALDRLDRRRSAGLPGRSRRRHIGTGARARADQRDRHHRDHVGFFFADSTDVSIPPILPGRVSDGHRAWRGCVLRLLVVGRIRGRAELRRGGQGFGQGHLIALIFSCVAVGRCTRSCRGPSTPSTARRGLVEDRKRGKHGADRWPDLPADYNNFVLGLAAAAAGRVLARRAELPDDDRVIGLRRSAHERGLRYMYAMGREGSCCVTSAGRIRCTVAVYRRSDLARSRR